MKIALVGHSLFGGGAEFVTRVWAAELGQRGHVVDVLSVDEHAKDLVALGQVHHIRLSEEGASSHVSRVRTLRSILRSKQYDVCIAMQTYPALVTLFAKSRASRDTTVIVSERNALSILLPMEGGSKRAQMLIARMKYRSADAIFAISHPIAADLVSGFRVRPDRCFVVPNPALAKFETITWTDFEKPTEEDDLTIVLPFRLVEQKRPWLAVRVASELRRRGQNVGLLSFGSGPLAESLREDAKSSHVPLRFAGWNERWFEACPRNAVVLLPSLCEGFGNVLVEAAAARIPSVAWSGALGVADAVIPGGTGILSVSDQVPALADAVLEARDLVVDPPKAWLRRFTLESSVDVLESAIRAAVLLKTRD